MQSLSNSFRYFMKEGSDSSFFTLAQLVSFFRMVITTEHTS